MYSQRGTCTCILLFIRRCDGKWKKLDTECDKNPLKERKDEIANYFKRALPTSLAKSLPVFLC